MTPPGIDPGTFRLVAQRLNHYATPGPPLSPLVFPIPYSLYRISVEELRTDLVFDSTCALSFYYLAILISYLTE